MVNKVVYTVTDIRSWQSAKLKQSSSASPMGMWSLWDGMKTHKWLKKA